MHDCSAFLPRQAAHRRNGLALFGLLLGVFAAPASGQGAKQACDIDKAKSEIAAVPLSVMAALSAPFASSSCGAVLDVVKLMGATRKAGGRKLEPDKPLDVAAAERERSAASADRAYASALAAELAGESDSTRRLVREAALLHDHGHYKARDLLLMQLRQGASK